MPQAARGLPEGPARPPPGVPDRVLAVLRKRGMRRHPSTDGAAGRAGAGAGHPLGAGQPGQRSVARDLGSLLLPLALLPATEQKEAYDTLARWTGATPVQPQLLDGKVPQEWQRERMPRRLEGLPPPQWPRH